MPATPAWPPSSLPRLFVDQSLSEGLALTLEGQAANYFGTVLRRVQGDGVKLFDDRTGEWLAEIIDVAKRRVTVRIVRKLREREPVPDLWLLFAPVKKGPIDWIVEKATELGCAKMVPVVTRRTNVERVNLDRLRAHIVEAAEQCDRTALPVLEEPRKLASMLKEWPPERRLIFADEQGGDAMAKTLSPGPAAILIGPEGGFTDEEREMIRAVPQAVPVSLGPRILRAETAAVAAVTLWMALAGDWNMTPNR